MFPLLYEYVGKQPLKQWIIIIACAYDHMSITKFDKMKNDSSVPEQEEKINSDEKTRIKNNKKNKSTEKLTYFV